MCVCVCVWVFVCMFVCVLACVCIRMCMHTHACVYMCVVCVPLPLHTKHTVHVNMLKIMFINIVGGTHYTDIEILIVDRAKNWQPLYLMKSYVGVVEAAPQCINI